MFVASWFKLRGATQRLEIVNKERGVKGVGDAAKLEEERLPRFKINIFYVISSVCSLVLVGYSWLVFLPAFKDTAEYAAVQNMVILLTVLLVAVSGMQIYLSVKREETQTDNSASKSE